jgi:hypothetical protein
MTAALIARFGGLDDESKAHLSPFIAPRLLNWNGRDVGFLRPAGPLA